MEGRQRESTARAFSKSCTCVSFRRRDRDWGCAHHKLGWQVVFRLHVRRLGKEHPDNGAARVIDASAPSRLLTTVSRLVSSRARGFLEEKFLRMARDGSLGFQITAIDSDHTRA